MPNNKWPKYILIWILFQNGTYYFCAEHLFSYPGPRGFSWFFFGKEIKSKLRSGDNESRKTWGEREKPLLIFASNLTFMQTTAVKPIQGGKTFCASFCASLIAGSRRAFLSVDCVCSCVCLLLFSSEYFTETLLCHLKCWKFNKRPASNKRPPRISAHSQGPKI